MSVRAVAAFAALCLSPAEARFLDTDSNADLFAGLSHMQPDVVGHLLIEVEKRWEEGCVSSIRKEVTQEVALAEMTKSCVKVTKAIVDGSDGDKDRVVEYMGDVCETVKGEEQKKTCNEFSSSVEGFLSNDSELNRNEINTLKFCQGFWSSTVEVAAKTKAKVMKDAEDVQAAKEEAERKQKEQEELSKQEAAKAQAEKDADVKSEDAIKQAISKTQAAQQDETKADSEVKAAESAMTADEDDATKLVDKARSELQAASENEAAAAEAKVAAETEAKDEAAAVAAGDAKAAEIVAKAEQKAQNQTKAEASEAADEVAAKAAGDAKADAIVAKATMEAAQAKIAAVETPVPAKKELAAAQIQQDPCAGCAEAFVAQHQKCMATMSNNPCTKQYTGVAFDNQCCGMAQQHARCMSCKSQGSRPHYNSKWTDQLNSGVTVTEGYSK